MLYLFPSLSKMKTIPNYERPLYEKLQQITQSLSSLKNNRNKYISSKQVYTIYDEFLATLHELSLTRKDEELKGITLNLPTGLDLLTDDIWSMLSLCFVTCGLTKFAPATYLSLAIVYKLLGHLKSCQVYTMDDLEPIRKRLEEIKQIILQSEELQKEEAEEEEKQGLENHKTEESLLLRNKWNKCFELLNELESNFKEIPSDLEPIYSNLVLIRKRLLNFLTNASTSSSTSTSTSSSSQPLSTTTSQISSNLVPAPESDSLTPSQLKEKIIELKKKLKEIELLRDSDGFFPSSAPQEQQDKSSMLLNGLLDDCNNFLNDISIQQDTPDISNLFKNLSIKDGDDGYKEGSTAQDSVILKDFQQLYSKLFDIKQKLENLLITRRWTMRETDLYAYSKNLKEIEEERLSKVHEFHEDQIPSSNIDQFKKLHMIILYLLRRCYSLIYKLLESSQPVSESLQPIHNQLSTVRRCLLDIKRIDGLSKLKELYPYQFKLASLDNLRKDGKFYVNGSIPEGQGLLNALLAECFDILHELKIELEEKEEEDDDEEGRDDDIANDITDEEDIQTDDEVELKRNRYVGFNEADYDQDSDDSVALDLSDYEYEGNDYY